MPLAIPADQVSIRGIKSSLVAGITTKPQSFQYQPTINQKRVETFDDDGFRIPGIPVPIAKDPKCSVGYNVVSPSIAALIGNLENVDAFHSAVIVFANTAGGQITFNAEELVMDGQSLSIDPLSDTAQIGFICTNPDLVSFS